jgi:hypothetical protein
MCIINSFRPLTELLPENSLADGFTDPSIYISFRVLQCYFGYRTEQFSTICESIQRCK